MVDSDRVVAIIPARGGSKRIPRKNIRQFSGLPMLAWPLRAAQTSQLFDRIVLSTDDREIAEIAGQYHAEVPFLRSPELSNDYATTREVIVDAINRLGLRDDVIVCCLYPTAPFVKPDDLRRALAIYEEHKWAYVFAAKKYDYPVYRSFMVNKEGQLSMLFPECFNKRSQDLNAAYHDAGQFYWANALTWKTDPIIFSERSTILELPAWQVCDIDAEEDWQFAEMLFKINQ